MYRKKNKVLTFLWSFLPGAAEMYMGFMKMGMSLLTPFAAIVALAAALNLGILLVPGVLVWFYAFFHAQNLAALPDGLFAEVQDDYVFRLDSRSFEINNKKIRRFTGILLILLGMVLIYNGIYWQFAGLFPEWLCEILWRVRDVLGQMIVGAAVIAVGISLIRGKKQELDMEEEMTARKEVETDGDSTTEEER